MKSVDKSNNAVSQQDYWISTLRLHVCIIFLLGVPVSVEVRGKLGRRQFFRSGFWGWISGHQAGWQVPLLPGPFPGPRVLNFLKGNGEDK